MRKSLVSLSFLTFALAACKESSTDPAAGPPTNLLVLAGGTTQSGIFGQPVPTAPTVLVTDAGNRPVPGVTVTFALGSGSGGGSLNSATQTTGATGTATVVWTLGSTFGTKNLTATVAGLAPVLFSATALAPPAGVLAFDFTDAVGDTLTFPTTTGFKAIDVVSLRGDFKSDSLIVTATFSAPIVLFAEVANGLGGALEFDIDDNAATGASPFANEFGGTASAGVEYALDLFAISPTTMELYSLSPSPTQVRVSSSGNALIARIPMALLGNDDGNFSIVSVFGTRDRATDLFPNAGQSVVRRSVGGTSALSAVGETRRSQRGTLLRAGSWKQTTANR